MPKNFYKYIPFAISVLLHMALIIYFVFDFKSNEIKDGVGESSKNLIPISFNSKLIKQNLKIKKINTVLNKTATPPEVNSNEKLKLAGNTGTTQSTVEKAENENSLGNSSVEFNSISKFSFAEGPLYPKIARENGLEGKVATKIIFKDGAVIQVDLVKSSGHSVLDNAVVNAVKTWKLNKKIDAEINRTFIFELNSNSN